MKKILLVLALLAVVALAVLHLAGHGWLGSHEGPGSPVAQERSAAVVTARAEALQAAARGISADDAKQVLFGDLHVHTTFSFDAFMLSLPLLNGEGSHPPADACDFARFCSALDFWSINDHAEGITPQNWQETVESIRQCNDVAQDPANPDTVAYLGWEWTQVGRTPEDHYGHKNVVFPFTDDERVPARPISSGGQALRARESAPGWVGRGLLALSSGHPRYRDLARYFAERDGLELCDPDADTRDLPADCFEVAETPADLFRKLDQWQLDSMVIPHGTAWGMYTPPGSQWDKQLVGDMNDPERQILLEVYSGHGDAEVYRDWRAVEFARDGVPVCPEPSADYLPSCWRAGEIIAERCLEAGESAEECARRSEVARSNAAGAGVAGHLTVPGARADEWLDAGQCRDCNEPAFNYRPGGSAQYILAVGNFDDPQQPRHFRMGFMGSSDNHFARPGTGYKELSRAGMTESRDRPSDLGPLGRFFAPPEVEPQAESVPLDTENTELVGFQLLEMERQASFFLTGGLIGVHSEGRGRESIWGAMKRKEVYGTSGPRILLWFDLLNPPGSGGEPSHMGSELTLGKTPIFRAKAVGSFEQESGCPDYATSNLSPDELQRICKGECYNPSDQRRLITRIEVVRVRPQSRPDEPLAELIDDPWRSFACEPDPAGCSVLFEDLDYVRDGRDTVYYVRAFEAPAPAINADNVRCKRDESGACLSVNLCGQDASDECLGEHEPRAWSSPIYVDHPSAS